MALSTAPLQSSMLALFVLLAPALVASEFVDILADVSDAHTRIATEAARADMPSFVLPEVVVTADRVAPVSLPEVVVTAKPLAPLSLPEVVVVADRFVPDARLVQADTLQPGQFEIAASAAPLVGTDVLGADETARP